MNTKFKILWFEDQSTWFNMEKIRVDSIIQEHFLVPDIERKDGDDFALDELTSNDYDLIIMDYQLAEGNTGDTIVSAIRKNSILTDILFYSSDEKRMLSAISSMMPPIDGFYLTERDYTKFTEKAKQLIEKIVKRSEDVVNLRGFVLDNTSSFEVRIKSILDTCWDIIIDENDKKHLTDMLKQILANQSKHIISTIEKAEKTECCFSSINDDKYALRIADRLEVLDRALVLLSKKHHIPDIIDQDGFKNYYYKKVGTYRNKLSHLKLGEKTISVDGQEVTINQELHRQLRRNISEVDSTIQVLEEFLGNIC